MDLIPNHDLLNLAGQVAIVTGGADGIGYGISYRLAAAGAKVVIVNRHQEEAQQAVTDLAQSGYPVQSVLADVSQEADIQRLVNEVVAANGKIDILVNNAGIFPMANLTELTTELFEQVINTNLRGVFLTTKYVSAQMITQGQGGKIINITSIDALHPSRVGLAAYDASKHGAWGFTKNVALELAPHGIQVNAVAPGGVMTPGVAKLQGQDRPERHPEPPPMKVPLGRMGVPDDIGKVVLFLASGMSSYLTGSQVVVDGGYLLQ